jgi:Flp pilus assembly protein TadD
MKSARKESGNESAATPRPAFLSRLFARVANRGSSGQGPKPNWLPTALAVLVMVALALILSPRRQTDLPSIPTAGLDPAVARLIESARDEVRLAPRSGAAWGKLGSVLVHYEFVEQGRAAFAQAEKLSPAEPRWPYLSALLLLNHDAATALLKLERAVALEIRAPGLESRVRRETRDPQPETQTPQPDMPRLRLAQFLAEHGREDEAERHFNALLRAQPDHAPAHLGLARLHHARGRLGECTNALRLCLDDRHTAKSAHALLSAAHRALGLSAEAEAAARRSTALPADVPWPDPYWEETLVWRVGRKAMIEDASALMDRGRLEEALPVLAQVTRDYPADDEAWYLMGWALNQLQRSVPAERALLEHLRRTPQSPKGHAQLAVSLLSQKRHAHAIEILEAGLKLKPTWRELHFNLGYAWVQLGRDDEAIRHFRNALAHDPNHPATYTALAELLARRGERDEARRLLRQLLILDPANPRAPSLLERVGE